MATDSRRRPDMAALDKGDLSTSASWKSRLEEMQRAEKRERLSREDSWEPKWFFHNPSGAVYPGEYGANVVPCYDWNDAYSKTAVAEIVQDPGQYSSLLRSLNGGFRIGVWKRVFSMVLSRDPYRRRFLVP